MEFFNRIQRLQTFTRDSLNHRQRIDRVAHVMFQSDVLGLCLNLGNAAMCGATVAITVFKRKQGGLGPSASS